MKLLCWNLRSFRDDTAAAASVIEAAGVDVVAIIEAPRFARWRSKRAALAREAGLLVGTADRVGGLCLMTTMDTWVTGSRHVELPRGEEKHRRALIIATLTVGGDPWTVGVTHLSLTDDQRVLQAGVLRRELAAETSPIVLAADVNEEPGGRAWELLAGDGFTDTGAAAATATFPSSRPQRRIDAVFASADLEVVSATVIDSAEARRASDHLPVLVELTKP